MTTTTATTTDHTLESRDFRLLWTGESISKAGSAVTAFAPPLVAVRTLGASPLMMGGAERHDLASLAARRAASRSMG
jgi:hypothetical protein